MACGQPLGRPGPKPPGLKRSSSCPLAGSGDLPAAFPWRCVRASMPPLCGPRDRRLLTDGGHIPLLGTAPRSQAQENVSSQRGEPASSVAQGAQTTGTQRGNRKARPSSITKQVRKAALEARHSRGASPPPRPHQLGQASPREDAARAAEVQVAGAPATHVQPLHGARGSRPVLPVQQDQLLLGTHGCALQHPLQLRDSTA